MNYLSFPGLFIFVSSISAGILIWFKNIKNPLHFTWGLFSLAVGFWGLGLFFLFNSPNKESALFWGRLLNLFPLFLPTFFFHFVCCFTNVVSRKKTQLYVYYLISIAMFLMAIIFPQSYVKDVHIVFGNFYYPIPGYIFYFLTIFFPYLVMYGLFLLYKNLEGTDMIKRNQTKYLFAGFLIGFSGGSMTFLPVYNILIPPIGVYLTPVYIITVTYAIIRFKLMDISLAFRYASANTLLSVFIGTPIAFSIWFLSGSLSSAAIGFFSPVIGYFLFGIWKPGTTETIVLSGKYATHKDENIQSHRDSIINSPTLRDWAENLCRSMVKLFDVKEVVVLVFDASHHYFASVSGTGLEQLSWGVPIIIENESPLAKMLEKDKKILIKEELQNILRPRVYEAIQSEMEGLSAELVVPFLMNDKLVGILAIGRKVSREMFNDLDLQSMWKVARGAEEALRALLLGLLQQQYSSEWAHDLLHPFGPKGSLHYVKAAVEGKYGALDPKLKEKFEDIVEEMTFVEKYMDALLNPLKYVQSGVYNIRPRILTHYFDQARRLYDEAAKEQGITWTVRAPPHTVKVMGDAVIIFHRVIKNLVENAFRHTPTGGSIELGHRMEDKILVIHVKDTGPGIPKEKHESIFERGTQGSDANKGKAGLGLYNARKVIESHHGKLWVESEPGKGSSFFFTLPLAPPETAGS